MEFKLEYGVSGRGSRLHPFTAQGHTDCHQVNSIKALCWAAKLFRLRVEDLYEGLLRPLVTAPASDGLRRESYPLPWRLVSYLEHALIFFVHFLYRPCSWPAPLWLVFSDRCAGQTHSISAGTP